MEVTGRQVDVYRVSGAVDNCVNFRRFTATADTNMPVCLVVYRPFLYRRCAGEQQRWYCPCSCPGDLLPRRVLRESLQTTLISPTVRIGRILYSLLHTVPADRPMVLLSVLPTVFR